MASVFSVVTPTAHAQPSVVGLRGAVVDAESGRPVTGAEVVVLAGRDTLARARTREDGRWAVRLTAGEYRVRVRRVGYSAAERVFGLTAGAPADLRVALAPAAVSLDAEVVTASRRIERLKDAPVAVRLVTRDDVERSGASNVAAVLTEQTGITPDGGVPAGAGVMLQGLDSRRVLVLVDGQPLVGRIGGNLDLSRVPASLVGRVEIVKGPQSTLYGSDAMGGVVNIVTRDAAPGPLAGGLTAQGGSQGRLDLSANAGGGAGGLTGFSWLADVGRRTVSLAPGRDGGDGALAERWDGAAKARWARDSLLAVDLSAVALDERQRYQTGQLYNFADNAQVTARASATWTRGGTRVQPILAYSRYDHLSRRALTPSPAAAGGDDDTQRLLTAELLASRRVRRVTVDGGVALRRETAASERVPGGARARASAEPYAQATFGGSLGKRLGGAQWSLVPGVRVTADDQWGTFVAPRAALMLRPAAPLALRLSAGRGFRAPDFKELYLSFLNTGAGFGYAVRGNAALRAERSSNASAGAEWAGERAYLRADLFANRFTDFIETRVDGDSSGVTFYTYGNVGRGVTRGVDLESVVRVRALRAEGGYGYLDAYASSTGEPLLGRPRHSARLTLAATTRRGLAASLGGVYTGRTPVSRDSGGASVERPGYLRVNARVAQSLPRRLGGAWRVEAGAHNLLDERPALWPGYTGRQVYAGLSWNSSN